MLFVLLLFICITQTSCWDKKEIEELSIVLGMALDKCDNGDIRVIVHIVNPRVLVYESAGSSGGGVGDEEDIEAFYNISCSGKTVNEAIRKMANTIPAELYFAHCHLIIISEELAREGIMGIMDLLFRAPQIRLTNWILISEKDADQFELLNAYCPLHQIPSKHIVDVIDKKEVLWRLQR